MSDITKYITKEITGFYADFEDYETSKVNEEGYEDGDIVFWVWENKKYRGVLRDHGQENEGMFELENVRERGV
jgi:hypothetical protein